MDLRTKLTRLERRRPRQPAWHVLRVVGYACGAHADCLVAPGGQHQAARPACDCPAEHVVLIRRVLAAGGGAEG